METMKDYMDGMLHGEMETITVSEFRASPGDILTQVSLGKSFCIKRKGEIVAFLVHPTDADVVHEVHSDGSAPTLGIEKSEHRPGDDSCPCSPCASEYKRKSMEDIFRPGL